MDTPDIVVVGCGASGALLCSQLFRQSERVLQVSCIEPRFRLGAGLAYGSARDEHLLNVPASRMSALPDQPDHFADWLHQRRLNPVEPARYFAPRRQYADYLTDCLGESLRMSPLHHGLHHEPHRVVRLKPLHGGWILNLDDGSLIWARAVVLALGNLGPFLPPKGLEALADHPGYVHDPWAPSLPDIDADDRVAIIGSGLSAVDQVLTLESSGHRGSIQVFSRHGAWPGVHQLGTGPIDLGIRAGSLPEVFRAVRRGIADQLAGGGAWQAVIDGLRPQTAALWATFTEAEKRRFLRWLASPWNRARHRMPLEVHERLGALERSGRLEIASCPQLSARPLEGRIEVIAGDDAQPCKVDKVFNCTGSSVRLTDSRQPLLAQLLEDGLVAPGPAGLGLANDVDGRVLGRGGLPNQGLWTIGPMRQGSLWESTAIPEIRLQAAVLASRLLEGLTAMRAQA